MLGCKRLVKEHLKWQSKSELKAEVILGIKEIGSILYWMGLLDIVLVRFLKASSCNIFTDNALDGSS